MSNIKYATLIALAVLVFFGCKAVYHRRVQPPLPSLPPGFVPSQAAVQPGVVGLPVMGRIGYAWECEEVAPSLATNLVTGLVATGDLRTWAEVALLPYARSNIVWFTNQPPSQFVRAFWRFK